MNPLTPFKKIPILPLLIALALVARSADAYLAAISDFNGDGHPDYVLQNANTGQTAIWYPTITCSSATFTGQLFRPTGGWWVWRISTATGIQIMLAHIPSTRQTAIWYLSGPTFIRGAYGPTPPSGWALWLRPTLTATGSGLCALQWRDGSDSDLVSEQQLFVSGATAQLFRPPTGLWLGVADFNRDGHPDYALYNGRTGQTAIWYLSGRTFSEALLGRAFAVGGT